MTDFSINRLNEVLISNDQDYVIEDYDVYKRTKCSNIYNEINKEELSIFDNLKKIF